MLLHARLVFMVAFFVIINGQVLTFYASLVFIPLAFFFMASLGQRWLEDSP